MYTANLWHKLYLHRTKIIVLLLLLSAFQVDAQRRKAGLTVHRVDSDDKNIKYGFFLGGHQNYYGLKYSDTFSTPEYANVSSITPNTSLGFNLGFMLNFRLADQFTLRVVPVKIGLYQHRVEYNYTDGTVDQQLIESTRLEPGIFLKYRSIRRYNSRMYVIAGVSGSWRAGKEDLATTIDRLEIGRSNVKIEVGIGLERYFAFFKLAPELRYARGIGNVMNETTNRWHNGIDRLVTHSFSLYFHFSD